MKLVLAATALALAAGCATTYLTSEWPASQAAAPRLGSVLVASDVPDESVRRNLEDSLTAELRAQGISAAPSYRVDPEGAVIHPDAGAQFASVHGFDGVLVVTNFRQGYELTYQPGTVLDYYYFGTWSTPFAGVDRIYPIGKTVVEARLLEAEEDGKLLWAGVAETYDERRAAQKLAAKLADSIWRGEDG